MLNTSYTWSGDIQSTNFFLLFGVCKTTKLSVLRMKPVCSQTGFTTGERLELNEWDALILCTFVCSKDYGLLLFCCPCQANDWPISDLPCLYSRHAKSSPTTIYQEGSHCVSQLWAAGEKASTWTCTEQLSSWEPSFPLVCSCKCICKYISDISFIFQGACFADGVSNSFYRVN